MENNQDREKLNIGKGLERKVSNEEDNELIFLHSLTSQCVGTGKFVRLIVSANPFPKGKHVSFPFASNPFFRTSYFPLVSIISDCPLTRCLFFFFSQHPHGRARVVGGDERAADVLAAAAAEGQEGLRSHKQELAERTGRTRAKKKCWTELFKLSFCV